MSTCINEGPDNDAIRELRDTLKKHTETIEKSNQSAETLNKTMLYLTGVGIVIALLELFRIF